MTADNLVYKDESYAVIGACIEVYDRMYFQ